MIFVVLLVEHVVHVVIVPFCLVNVVVPVALVEVLVVDDFGAMPVFVVDLVVAVVDLDHFDVDLPSSFVVLLLDVDVATGDPFSSFDVVDVRCCDDLGEMQV